MAQTRVWRRRDVEATICCEQLAQAFERGTDNEEYESLAGEHPSRNGTWAFHSTVEAPNLCPWCGAGNKPGVLKVVGK